MDIDLTLLRTVEREKDIPFDELVRIIEQAILTAYAKHTSPTGEAPEGARAQLDRKTGHVAIFVPLLDDEGVGIGEEETTPENFGRIAAFTASMLHMSTLLTSTPASGATRESRRDVPP